MPKCYAGIGSRETPPEILAVMEALGTSLGSAGWTLRSGAADGADSAFERGADRVGGAKEIFLPWPRFSGRTEAEPGVLLMDEALRPEAERISAAHHPAWRFLSFGARRLHARNALQILGPGLDCPADLVICFTPRGAGGGGTGQAIRIAASLGVPVFDLGVAGTLERLDEFLHP